MGTTLNLTHFTLTGVDEKTSLESVASLSESHPVAEWGFLYSPSRQGLPGRYPSIKTLVRAFQSLPPHVRVAMHVCGSGVSNLIVGKSAERQLLDLVAARGGRVQLNFNQLRYPVALGELIALLDAYRDVTFITQINKSNHGVWESLAERGAINHVGLFDASGGRGIVRSEWPQPLPISCGYAGGLGPDNIQQELDRIAAVAGSRSVWVDMEGKLRRTDASGVDWLDLDACRTCLEAAQAYLQQHEMEA